jgi:hypothetical protein
MAQTRKHHWLRIVGIGLGVLVALVLVALVVVAVRADAWANHRADELETEWSRTLERPVRIGTIDVSPLTGRVHVAGLTIGAAKGERAAPEALALEGATIDVGVLRTLLSLGRDPYVESVAVHGVRLNVVRRPDGTLNWQEIAERSRRGQAPETQQPQRPSARERNTVVDDARLDGQIAFVDLGSGSGKGKGQRAARISAIDLHVEDAGYKRGMRLALQAAVLADARNLQLRARTSGLREERGRSEAPELRELTLHLAPTELAPLAPFLAALGGAAGDTLEQGVLSADAGAHGDGDKRNAQGSIALAGARFGRGERFDARFTFDLERGGENGSRQVNVKQALLQAGDMSLAAHGAVTGLDKVARFRDVDVRSHNLNFDRIRALYPGLDRRTAPARLGGPFVIRATGSGTQDAQQLDVQMDMTTASVDVPDRFAKPKGTPMLVHGAARTRGDAADISELAVQVADFRVVGRGRVRDLRSDTPKFDVRFDTPSPRAASLMRLLPGVPATSGAGQLTISGRAEGTSDAYTADGKLVLAGLDVRAKNGYFAGGGQATFAIRKQARRWNAEAKADFGRLRAVYPGVIDKPDATPWSFEATLSGVPGRPRTFEAHVPNFAVSAGRSDMRGSFQLANLVEPQITLRARSKYLDPDDFIPASEDEAREQKQKPSALAKADGSLALHADAGALAGVPYEKLELKARLHDGRAKAETLRVSSFGGQLTGSGSELPLFGSKGPWRLRGELKSMEAQELLARLTGAPELVRGTFAGTVDLTSKGTTLDDVRESLTGTLSGGIADARFLPGSGFSALAKRLRSLADNPALAPLGRAAERVPDEDSWQLEDLEGALRFDRGAVLVQRPLTAKTPQGALSLRGRLALSEAGKLEGTWNVEPKAIESLVGKKVDLKQPVPIALRIEGPLTDPRFGFGNMEPVLDQVAQAYGKATLEGAARKELDKALEQSGIGTKERESRGAKRQSEKQKDKEPQSPADRARREIEKRLGDF